MGRACDILRRDNNVGGVLQYTDDHHFALDLLVRTPATLQRRLALGDPFLHEVLSKRIVLYERADG